MTIKDNVKKTIKKVVQSVDSSSKYLRLRCNNNQIKTTMNNTKNKKSMGFVKGVINIVHRFLVLMFRMLIQFLYGEKGESMPPIKNLILLDSATTLAYKIRTRKLTSVEVVKAFIQRIHEVNPMLNIVVDERFADALKDAEKADAFIASGVLTEEQLAKEKPFLGVPITTKDCIRVKGMLHTAGLVCRKDIRGEEDAESMGLMRKAGAIPLALTNVSECCMWWESFNKVHGRSNNPYDVNRIVGGSSGGEGAIQAAAASPFGLGSDIGGSIRMPAFFNGIFGHKPSKFIVSNDGQFPNTTCPEQNSFLALGPMSRFAKDLKPMLKIMAGANAQFLDLDEPVNLTKLRYFYQESDGGSFLVSPVDTDIKEAIQRVAAHFKRTLKVETVKKVQIEKFRKSIPIWMAAMKTKEAISFDRQLANLEGKINPWIELLKFPFGLSNFTLVALLTAITEKTGAQYGSPKHQYLIEQKKEMVEEIRQMLGNDGVFIYPTHPTVAPYHYEPVIRAMNFGYTGIFNILGLPSTAVPLGLGREGLPIGLQVVANINQDRLCLAVACELERAFGGWVAPEVLA
uniref:CSON004845 protein n=1 Tax=Culicoides sonorensis TaxID=179676 RepID=A0A336K9U2_CULSO